MIDNGYDEYVTLLSSNKQKARIIHQCKECCRNIESGEYYVSDKFVYEGKFTIHKICNHCVIVRNWLSAECGGWLYGNIKEDLCEHVHNSVYPMEISRLVIGMKWKWKTPTGKMLSIPNLPKTSQS